MKLINAERLTGKIGKIYGDASGIYGDVSYIWGDVSGIWGDVTDIIGDVTSIRGYMSSIIGDVSGITSVVESADADAVIASLKTTFNADITKYRTRAESAEALIEMIASAIKNHAPTGP